MSPEPSFLPHRRINERQLRFFFCDAVYCFTVLDMGATTGGSGGSGPPKKNLDGRPPTFYIAFWWGLVGLTDCAKLDILVPF